MERNDIDCRQGSTEGMSAEKRRESHNTALRRACFGFFNLVRTGFQHSGLEPFANQSQQSTIVDSLCQHFVFQIVYNLQLLSQIRESDTLFHTFQVTHMTLGVCNRDVIAFGFFSENFPNGISQHGKLNLYPPVVQSTPLAI